MVHQMAKYRVVKSHVVPSLQESCVLAVGSSRYGVMVFFHGQTMAKKM